MAGCASRRFFWGHEMAESVAVTGRAGARAWLIWSLGAFCFGYAFFLRVTPSVMVDELMRDFAVGGAMLGNLSAIYFYAYAGLQLPVGVMLDRWGPRRMLAAAITIAALGGALFASADTVALAYLGRLLVGAGCAVGFVGTLTLATQWFPPERFAFLTGMTMLVGMLGGVAGQGPLAAAVEALGWRETLWLAATLGAVLAASIWLVVRDQPPGAPAAIRGSSPGPDLLADLRAILSGSQNWVIALHAGATAAPMLAYGALWGVPHLGQAYGFSRPVAAASASLVLIGWAAGAPLAGWISDRLARRRPVLIVGALLSLLFWPALLYTPGLPREAAGCLLFAVGMTSGAMIVSYAVAREFAPARASGASIGLINMMSVGSGAIFQPVVGALLDANWDGTMQAGARVYSLAAYEMALLVMPACAAVGLITAFLVRETYGRPVAG